MATPYLMTGRYLHRYSSKPVIRPRGNVGKWHLGGSGNDLITRNFHQLQQGGHGLTNKHRPFEESAGVPLVVSFPGRNQPRDMNQPVAGIDILATCLDWAGISKPEDIDGTSFLSHVCHKSEQAENETCENDQPENQPTTKPVFVESRNWCMIVDGHWKLVAERNQPHLTPTHLYNLNNDPYELSNLCHDHHMSAIQERLTTLLQQWCASTSPG